MILRNFTFCFTYLSVFFLLIPAGVAGEDAGSKTGASYFLSMTENSLLPERNSAYVGTRVYVLSDPEAWLEVATETSPLQWFDELVMDLPILGNHDPDYASVINPETSFKEGMVMSCDAFLANIDDALVSGPDPSTPFVETADVFGNTGSFNCGTENAYPSPILSTEQSNGFGTAFCPAPTPMILRGTDESYQVVVGGNFTVPSQGGAEIEGRAAIGGNLDVNRIFGLGESGGGTFVVSEPGEYLQVGGNVTGTGPINTGTNTATGPGQNTALIGGTNAATINSATVQQGATLTFDIAQQLAEMSNASMGMSIATPTGSFAGGVLTGTNAALEIFNITAADVSSSVLTFADIAPGATIVVNVSGAGAINFAGSRNGRVNDPQSGSSDPDALVYNVVWNFYETTGVVTVNPNVTSGIHGLVLIPNGNLTLNTNLNGRLFVGGDVTFSSPTAFGPEIHNYPFTGDLSSFCGGAGMCDVTAIAFAIQPSCDSDGNIAVDGYVQLSAVTDGLSYSVNEGSTYDGSGVRTTLTGETFPLQILTGLANPAGSQDYTVRVYKNDVGGAADGCFTDVVVTMQQQDCTVGCDCNEYVYLAEPAIGAVLKFEVGPDLLLTELNQANGGTAPNQHWYPGTGASELPSPHGVTFDLNGTMYIGSNFQPNSTIRKFSCDGTITPINDATIIHPYVLTNMFSIGNTLYTTRSGGPASFDFCSGNEIGTMCLNNDVGNPLPFVNSPSPDNVNWGLSYNTITQMVYVTGQGTTRHGVWAYTQAELDSGMQGGPCIDPLIWRSTTVPYANLMPGDQFLPSDMASLNGIVSDNDGNIYVAGWLSAAGSPGFVLKYDPQGRFVAGATPSGAINTRGIVWSESTNRIYVANQTDDPAADCIGALDADDLTYLGAAAPNPNLPVNNGSKAISIVNECCPTSSNQTVQVDLCNPQAGEAIFLNEIFPCSEGTICEAQWVPADAVADAVFNDCDLSIMAGTAPGCYTFTRSSDGTGNNAQCGAFVQTLTVAIGEVTASTMSGSQEICSGADPDPFTVATAATGSDALIFQWYVSTESDSTGFAPIVGATMEAYDPTPADIVADTMYFRNEVFITTCTEAICRDTSNTVIVITVQDFVIEAGNDLTVCSTTTVDLGGASIMPDDFMAMDGTVLGATWTSSGTGMFFNAVGDMLTAPVRLGEATSYQPSGADNASGSVTLTLTMDNPSDAPFNVVGCMPFVDEMTITILNVDCGTFPWGDN